VVEKFRDALADQHLAPVGHHRGMQADSVDPL
jgi:hypothetical protein